MMDWLNYHHLRYFHAVAKEGSLAAAATQLRVSSPAISEQIRELETALGERLFRREGRANKLTEMGQMVFGYAEEIFTVGQELLSAVKHHPGVKALRLHVGVVDAFPKFLTNEILRPVFAMPQAVQIVCHEGKLDSLMGQLSAHRLDVILADEPAFSTVHPQTSNHLLGESDTTFCGHPALAALMKSGFPRTLHEAPAILPAGPTPFRRNLETWFRSTRIRPRVIAEVEDLALMKVIAADGLGFIAIPTVAAAAAIKRYGFEVIGRTRRCVVSFYAIVTERRIAHPAVSTLIATAKRELFR